MKKTLFLILSVVLLSSCTDNQRARKFGGTERIELDPNQRLVNITWKEDQLWILTNENSQTPPSTYKFQEKSSWGVVEGTVVVVEK